MEKKVFMFFRRKDDSASARTVRSIPDEQGEVTRPVNFRKGFYRILKTSGIETKGLHSIRHPINQRHKGQKREHQIPHAQASSRPPRPHHFRNYRALLRQERHEDAEWDNRWV